MGASKPSPPSRRSTRRTSPTRTCGWKATSPFPKRSTAARSPSGTWRSILSGFTFWFTGGATIFQTILKGFTYLGTKSILGVPILPVIMLASIVVFWFVMRHTAFGRKLYAIGGVVAFVIPDMAAGEPDELAAEMAPLGTDVPGFTNPEMTARELEYCFDRFSLVYQQLYAGRIGMPVLADDFAETLSRAHAHPAAKAFADFGISTPQRMPELLAAVYDEAIVGTVPVKKFNESPEALYAFVKELKAATEAGGIRYGISQPLTSAPRVKGVTSRGTTTAPAKKAWRSRPFPRKGGGNRIPSPGMRRSAKSPVPSLKEGYPPGTRAGRCRI